MNHRNINFDRELNRGRKAYEGKVGHWWNAQALDASHQYAYRNIANFIRSALPKSTGFIIDYACGSGHILSRLPQRFSRSRFLGLDGSSLMLNLAKRRIARQGKTALEQTSFQQTLLPNFSLPREKADAVVFIFPNIVVSSQEENGYQGRGYKKDAAVARYLAAAREPDPEDETETDDEDSLYDTLMDDKQISRNLRILLKPGGLCLRAEYSNAHRREFTRLVRQRKAFEEGSLATPVDGTIPEQLFRYIRSRYFRSKVVEDVYHQTLDKEDKEGGYNITLLKAL